MRLADSERNVMEVLWENGATLAKDVAATLTERVGWGKTTTYTMITRCIDKGYIRRDDPKFRCVPLLSKEEITLVDTQRLLTNDYNGSAAALVEYLVAQGHLSLEELEEVCAKLKK